MRIFEGVAQLAEHLSFKSGVRGSNPFTLTIGTIAITHTYSFFLVQLIKVSTGIISSFELVSIIAAIVPLFRRNGDIPHPSVHTQQEGTLSLESRWLLGFSSLSCCVSSKLNLVTKYLVYLEIYRSNITGSIPVASTIVQRQAKHSFVIFHHTTTRYAIHIAKWQRHTAMLKVLSFS